MAHDNFDVAREALIDCLMQFEALDSLTGVHPITLELFARGSPLREQVLAVVRRERTFQECPGLLKFRYAPHFVPTNETSIEQKHASVHGYIKRAPHHSETFVSGHLCRFEVLEQVRTSAPNAQQFLQHYYRIASFIHYTLPGGPAS